MKYKTIWSWQLMDKIMEGEKVYMVDKQKGMVLRVGEVPVNYLVIALKADEKAQRFEFWVEEEEAQDAEL